MRQSTPQPPGTPLAKALPPPRTEELTEMSQPASAPGTGAPHPQPRHYHLIGIGGTAMASLAGLLRAAGHRVTGSDESVYPPMSTQLQELGIHYAEGYSPANLDVNPDIVVVGNAISRGNPELEAVLDRRMLYTAAAVVIKDELLRGRHVLAVAGTHGKTTTTSLLAWILESAGLNPSFLIGGIAENFGSSFRLTDSEYFVIEADEYDTAYFDKGPKMWHYLPVTAIVNNIEFDHADIYRDEIAYRFAFERFINLIPRNGTLVAGWDSPIMRELGPRSHAPIESFGYEGEATGEHPRWTARDVSFGEQGTTFTALHDGQVWGEVKTTLSGAFNVRNALAVIAAAEAIGADKAGVLRGFETFASVKRRMEVRGEARGVTVIDDFAHHPTAVRETIQAVRQRYPGRPIVAIFEPRSYTAQRREFQQAYAESFASADRVVLAGLFHPERYTEDTAMNPHELVEGWRGQGKTADFIPSPDDIVARITPELKGGEVVLVMSNGGFGGIHGKLLEALGDGRE
jgi:UDP-N-acetylmuramate: L-alanyl-gamma-D-glutamyl-meso-diaminopimelate ligase